MKNRVLSGVLIMFIVCTIGLSGKDVLSALRAERQQQAKVCFDPSVPCKTSVNFESYDLPFEVPKNAVIWETKDFYAIILRSVSSGEGDCERFVPESERLKAQELFPKTKVFASRPCNPGGLFYTNIAPDQQFMAVYAGATKAQAERLLAAVKATGSYPGANIRRMRAGFNGT
jgi:hypothetical protein